METGFKFNRVTDEQIEQMNNTAYIFNISRDDISQIRIAENKFTTEDLGNCAEYVDIFVDTVDNNVSKLINVEELLTKGVFFSKELESGSGVYLLGALLSVVDSMDIKYKGVLVITRTMSNFLMDAKEGKIAGVYYSICPKEASLVLELYPEIDGWVAKNRVKLTENYKEEIRGSYKEAFEGGRLSEYRYNLFKGLSI